MRRSSLILIGLVVTYLAWFGTGGARLTEAYSFQAHHPDYYNLLAEGMQSGHLWMNLPYDSTPGADHGFVNDASLYHEHYYIYFGPTPEVLLFLPFLEVTGREMPPSLAVVLFISLGFLCQVAVLLDVRKRYLPQAPAFVEAGAILLLAFGASTPILTVAHQVYEVAIASAYGFASVAWLCLYLTFYRPASRGRWLAGASLAVGLAVGCRPDCIVLLGAIGLAAIWFIREAKNPRGRLRLALAAVAPAAAVGILLAAYNVARFGRVGEFGQTYQANDMAARHLKMFSLVNVTENLGRYLFRPPLFSPYFPYFLPLNTSSRPAGYFGYERVHGHFAVLILALVLVGAVIAVRRKGEPPAALRSFLLLVSGSSFALLAFICAFGSSADRYAVDFLGSLALVLAMVGLWAATRLGRLARICLIMATAFVVTDNALFPFQDLEGLLPSRPAMAALFRLGNYPSYVAQKFNLIHYGPRRLAVVFAAKPNAVIEPLITSGTPLGHDRIESVQESPTRVRLLLDHEGYGSISSATQTIVAGQPHVIEVDLGAYYPPRFHPYFDGWAPAEVQAVKTAARIVFDGHEILRTRVAAFDTPPENIVAGTDPQGTLPPYSGRVVSFGRIRETDPRHNPAFLETGVWRMRLEPDVRHLGLNQPVLAAGVAEAGNQLFLQTLAGGKVRLGLDTWGMAPEYSEPIATDSKLHEVCVLSGAQVLVRHPEIASRLSTAAVADLGARLTVWWDGKLVWNKQVRAFPQSFGLVGIGANAQGFSSTGLIYAGPFDARPFTPAEADAFIAQNLDLLGDNPFFVKSGTWRVRVSVDPERTGTGQPILTGGAAGAGEQVFLQALGEHRIRFGLDTWGTAADYSPPLACSPGLHEIAAFGGAQVLANHPELRDQLTPPQAAALKESLVLWWDGAPVWTVKLKGFPDSFDSVALGANRLGFSSAAATYTGTFEPHGFSATEAETFIAQSLNALKLGRVSPAP